MGACPGCAASTVAVMALANGLRLLPNLWRTLAVLPCRLVYMPAPCLLAHSLRLPAGTFKHALLFAAAAAEGRDHQPGVPACHCRH